MQDQFPVVPTTSNTHPLIVADVEIRRDAQGRYCLNDLHRAAGGEEKHGPGRWLRTYGCKSLISAIKPKMAYSPIEAAPQVGTFVVKQLVYAYAMWISAEFHLRVIDTFDAVVTGQYQPAPVDPMQLLNDPATLRNLCITYSEKVLTLEHKVDALKPKADIADRITISDGLFGFRHAAKILKINENKFRNWLIQNDWIYYLGKKMTAKSPAIKKGYLEEKMRTLPCEAGEEPKTVPEMYFTAAGIHKLAEIFNVELELSSKEAA